MKLREYQNKKVAEASPILDKYGIVYLAMQERTGKTLVALKLMDSRCKNILVLTKKGKPIEGWLDTLKAWEHKAIFKVTNYHQASKLEPIYDGIILDESHNYISAVPKTGKLYKYIKRLTYRPKVKIVYISATPHAQGRVALHPQFGLSLNSPFRNYKNYYNWHKEYGIQDLAYLPGRTAETYKKCNEDMVRDLTRHLFITGTRKSVGFSKEPCDKIHWVELSEGTKKAYNILIKKGVLSATSLPEALICDTSSRLRASLHQIEGGSLKFDTSIKKKVRNIKTGNMVNKIVKASHECIDFKNKEKIDYILENWGDTKELVIMYHYQCELPKLTRYFKNAAILQGQRYSEGVDLSMYKHLVIFSQDWSTAKYIQRRARQANKHREEDIIVHFLLSKKAISEQVYKTVAINKVNFTDPLFDRSSI